MEYEDVADSGPTRRNTNWVEKVSVDQTKEVATGQGGSGGSSWWW